MPKADREKAEAKAEAKADREKAGAKAEAIIANPNATHDLLGLRELSISFILCHILSLRRDYGVPRWYNWPRVGLAGWF